MTAGGVFCFSAAGEDAVSEDIANEDRHRLQQRTITGREMDDEENGILNFLSRTFLMESDSPLSTRAVGVCYGLRQLEATIFNRD